MEVQYQCLYVLAILEVKVIQGGSFRLQLSAGESERDQSPRQRG